MPASETTKKYRPDIDGLRALAVLAVVIFHAFPDALPGGFIGVDIFFVISGYLISGHIMENLRGHRFSYRDFYIRRIKRIFPALIVMMIGVLILGWLCLYAGEIGDLGKDMVASTIFSANILFWHEAGYFDQPADSKILLHLWSLGIEEQFYIFWPILLAAIGNRQSCRFWIIAALFALSLVACIVNTGPHPMAAFYSPLTRFWELFAGALLAHIHLFEHDLKPWMKKHSKDILHLVPALSAAAGLLLIGDGLITLNRDSFFPGFAALLPVGGAFLLIYAGPTSRISRALATRWPVYMGRISYPLYLWHWPALVYCRILSGGTSPPAARLTTLGLAVGLAILTYHFVEKPIRVGLPQTRKRDLRIVGSCLCLMLAFCLIGVSINLEKNVLPFRFSSAAREIEKSPGLMATDSCHRRYPYAKEFCVQADEARPATAALLGDSHAMHFYDALLNTMPAAENLLLVGAGNCPPLYDVDLYISKRLKNCPSTFDPLLMAIEQTPSTHTVILSSYAISTATGTYFGEDRNYIHLVDQQHPEETLSEKIYLDGLERTLRALTAAHKSVILIMDNPELDFDPIECQGKRPFSLWAAPHPCAVLRADAEARLNPLRQKVRQLLVDFPEVVVVDPLPALCDATYCYAKSGETFWYRDKNHLTVEGARKVLKSTDIFANKQVPIPHAP